MRGCVFVCLLIGTLSFGEGIEALIAKGLKNNPDLQRISANVEQSRLQKEISRQFDNPNVQLLLNDIQSADPTNRSIEPMQFGSITLQQKLPFAGKRDARYDDAKAQEETARLTLKQAQVLLAGEIKKESYRIWEIQESLKIYHDYEIIVQQNTELYTALSSAASGRHMGIMSSQMDLSQIKIFQANLRSELERAYASLSQLVAEPVVSVDVSLTVKPCEPIETYQQALSGNFSYKAKDAQIRRTDALLKQAQLDFYPDVTVQVGYAQRETYNDYWTLGVNIPLPIYGTESTKAQIVQEKAIERNREKEVTRLQLEAALRQKYAEVRNAQEIWRVIHEESLPQLNHMFELSEASIRNGEDLFRFTELLKQKQQLELQQVRAVSAFYRSLADLDLLIGKEP
ncbi:MAG: TolC family protein [Sulfuricurvum sp.]|uniref:TolC family protein n=1 Tax=Sulfuricurvum sp. TaxID=2025608 RepID=UPI00262F0E02|nr:TolC family protein [Sulfuricurvum sp.]MDD3597570.1 TolC family protein [Sulfuricurvum sp.]